jgi:hypothetical protein
MSALLLAPDFRRLVNVFLLNRVAEPADFRFPEFAPGWRLLTSRIVWAVVFFGILIGGGVTAYRQYLVQKPRPPLYGMYAVESETPIGWHRVVIESPDWVSIRMRDGRVVSQAAEYDVAKQVITFNKNSAFRWSRQDGDRLVLSTTWEGKEISIRMRRIDEALLLRTRGFHWVQEYPYNR